MSCPQCHFDNPPQMKFCVECGAPLVRLCPQCGAEALANYKFCGECGASLQAGTPAAPPAPPPARAVASPATEPAAPSVPAVAWSDGERKQVTVLLCELVPPASESGEPPSPDLLHALLNQLSKLGRAEVERFGGTVHRFLDQGFMALFGAPVAHEDHARRAVLTGSSLVQRLGERSAELEAPHGVRFTVRIGIDTGSVVVGALGTVVGEPTTVAARLQQSARPGQVLISDATARWVRDHVELVPEEDVVFDGEAAPVWRVKPSGAPPVGPIQLSDLSPFVGRDHELATLEDLREQARQGQGQVAGIAGEAGSGKSRLLHEFFRRTFPGGQVSYLRGQCLSYGAAVPYLPIVDMMRRASSISASEAPEAVTAKIRESLGRVGTDPETALPYFLRLLGVDAGSEVLDELEPQAIRSRTFAALRRMLLDASRRALVVVEIEDVQWIDETSERFLTSLVEILGAARILLLLTYRSGFKPRWLEKSYATQIALRRLSEEDSRRLAGAVLKDREIGEARFGEILAKAEGNPLFLEELARSLAAGGAEDAAVPDTIQGILTARIDRLPEEHKQLLKTAAVLGREFSFDLLAALWDRDEPPQELLEDLRGWEIVYKVPSEEETHHFFKHTLTQEVVYDSVLTHRRRELHRRAAEALEEIYAGHLEDAYGQLVYHYPRAGEPAKTVHYLTLFAERAARGYAHAEAAKALREALVQAEELDGDVRDRQIVAVLLKLAESLLPLARFPETLELCERYAERVAGLGDPSLDAQYRFWRAHTYTYLGNQEETRKNARLAIDAARECGDETTEGKACYVLGRDGFWSGQFSDGIEASLRAVVLLERGGEPWWQGQAYWVAGFNHYVLGQLEKGVEALERTCSIGEALDDYRLDASWSLGYFYASLGEGTAGIEKCRRGLERSQDPLNTAVAQGFLGYAELKNGDVEKATRTLCDSVERLRDTGMQQILGWFSVFLGEAYLAGGELEAARESAERGLSLCGEARFRYGVALGRHTLGRIALAKGDPVAAKELLDEALAELEELQVPFEAGRVRLDLARWARAGGEEETAVRELSEARRTFEELHVPRYVERAAALAGEWGFPDPKSLSE